ncbi:hypothetical protein FOC29_28215 [Burkholderia vietnamiensis]|uniref:hypothetical protein n=1 Tax=Burkholderia vietnamiensis TaxID=60552 RepID=UPI001EE5C13A|nr:hypothetical protein [Burkholderia vietnamiensis]UKV75196.1 hypothetical protein FOC29_28215 [Burkholderia vietnamiensis]
MTTNTYGGYTVDQLREFIRHHYDAEHGGDNIDELTNDSSANVKIVRDLLDAIEPQQDGDLLRPIARWVYNAVRVNLDLLHGICSEFGCPQGANVATWLRDRLSNEKSPAPEQASEAAQQRSGMDRPFTEVVPTAEVIVDVLAVGGNETSLKLAPRFTEWRHPRAQATDSAWRELCHRLYVELFHCDQQMRSTRDEDGEPHWTQSSVVRDVLADAKAALEGTPAQAGARVGMVGALRRAREELSIVEWENDPPRRVVKLLDEIGALLQGANHAE